MINLPKITSLVIIPFMTATLTNCGGSSGGDSENQEEQTDLAPEVIPPGKRLTITTDREEANTVFISSFSGELSHAVSTASAVYGKTSKDTSRIITDASQFHGTITYDLKFTSKNEGTCAWYFSSQSGNGVFVIE